MAAANDVIDTLLSVREGEQVQLEAQHYEFKTPHEVTEIDEQSWRAPGERVWRSRRVRLESQPTRGRRSERDLDVYPDAPAPEWGGHGQLVSVERVDDEPGDDQDEPANHPDWLERPADAIVSMSPVNRSLEEVLDEVERQDSVLGVHQRISGKTITSTKELLWELGLRDQAGHLLEDEVLQERVEELRRCYC